MDQLLNQGSSPSATAAGSAYSSTSGQLRSPADPAHNRPRQGDPSADPRWYLPDQPAYQPMTSGVPYQPASTFGSQLGSAAKLQRRQQQQQPQQPLLGTPAAAAAAAAAAATNTVAPQEPAVPQSVESQLAHLNLGATTANAVNRTPPSSVVPTNPLLPQSSVPSFQRVDLSSLVSSAQRSQQHQSQHQSQQQQQKQQQQQQQQTNPLFLGDQAAAARVAADAVAPQSASNVAGGSEIGNAPSRTVYLGNVPSGITPHELLNHVRSGIVESIRIIPAKNCAFVSFLDENSAMLFHSDAILKRLTINNHEVKVGWGKPTPVQPVVSSCVSRYHATRNVYLGNLPDSVHEDEIERDLAEYGEIEAVKIIPEKRIAFVHFTSILAAIRCVQALPLVPEYRDRKVFYGKDRCAFITKTQQHNAAQYLGLDPNSDDLLHQVDREMISNALVQQSNAAAMIATAAGGSANLGNRTIYLGNLHPDTTIEEICNVVRGGVLQNVRPIPERHVCFVTFVDPISAAQFYAMSSLHGLIIHNRKIKVGWGKHSGPLPNSLNLAVGHGASRNIYIGGLDKIPEIAFTHKKLYDDFKEFGEIEQINFFEQRHCAFVNFTNISNAIKAIDGIRNNPDYKKCKINFGKDRCGNVPRQFQMKQNGMNNVGAVGTAGNKRHGHDADDKKHEHLLQPPTPQHAHSNSTASSENFSHSSSASISSTSSTCTSGGQDGAVVQSALANASVTSATTPAVPAASTPVTQSNILRYPLYSTPKGNQPPPLKPLHQHSQFGTITPSSAVSSEFNSPRVEEDDDVGYVRDGAGQLRPLGIIMNENTTTTTTTTHPN